MGEGTVLDASGRMLDAPFALEQAGIEPVQLREKEGLALINGTDGMLGMLVLAIDDLRSLLKLADVAAAMSVEGLLGTDDVFAADLHELRPHRGQALSAANIRAVMADSPIREPTARTTARGSRTPTRSAVRPRSWRGARHDRACGRVAETELASAIDNPVVTKDGRVESNGNFHGAPVAYVLDFLAIVAADVASMSERRTDRFLDKARNQGLPAFLAHDPGVDSGLMIAQYTQAAMVSELKRLAAPASVDSIPSSAMQEDHVSMGWSAARKLRRSVDALGRVLAIELVTAARGLALRSPLEPGPASQAVIRALEDLVGDTTGPDRVVADTLGAAYLGVLDRSYIAAADRPAPLMVDSSRPLDEGQVEWVRELHTRRGLDGRELHTRQKPAQRHTDITESAWKKGTDMEGARPVRAPRGTQLTAQSWATEAPLRMLMNNLDPEVAERPDDLVVYGGTGRAARDWTSFDAMVRTLTTLKQDETMLVQSGRPVGVMRTHEWAPRVLIANSNLVGDWANWPEFRRLEHLGLTMYGQMTAGSWIYIGTQGILQGTYETFAAVAEKRFGGTLAGTLTLTAGCGGMGGAQPLAVTFNGGACLIVDVDPSRLSRRVEHRYLDEVAESLDEAVEKAVRAKGGEAGLVRRVSSAMPPRCSPSCCVVGCRSTSSPTRPRRTTR